MEFIIITGMSGAGKSQVKKIFEDMGFYCIDNLPPVLITDFAYLCKNNMENLNKVAIVSDVRNGEFFKDLKENLKILTKFEINYKILFLDASDDELLNRYKETRRTHPLTPNGSIIEGIEQEREILQPIKKDADFIINTNGLNLTDLKTKVVKVFSQAVHMSNTHISLMSFGFKRGIPLEADYVFDVRFLPNPYYNEDFRLKTGNDIEVMAYVMSFEESQLFFEKIKDLVHYSIDRCIENERKQVVIAIGCTGGHHRSVTFINKLFDNLNQQYENVTKRHRDIDK